MVSNFPEKVERAPHILICAGESSGDMHGAALIRAWRARHPDARISAVAGEAMRAAGCESIMPMESLNVMGLGDVLRALPRILRIARRLTDWAAEQRPDLVVLIDFPGFHLRLGARFRRLGIPVLYYIAPKLWAWGAWRVAKLRRAQDRLACILPFEPAWFATRGIVAEYVGNPSAHACIDRGWSREELCRRHGLDPSRPLLALLPGSRAGELARHLPLLVEVGREVLRQMPQVQLLSARAPGVDAQALAPLKEAGVVIVDRLQDGYALRVDAALAVSGTATLELALWNVPSVLVYRNSPLMIGLARRLVATRCAGLANIILDDTLVMPECIQEHATLAHVLPLLLPLLRADSSQAREQRRAFAHLRECLGSQDPALGVCRLVERMLDEGSAAAHMSKKAPEGG